MKRLKHITLIMITCCILNVFIHIPALSFENTEPDTGSCSKEFYGDISYIYSDDEIFIPIRVFSDIMGYYVKWDGETKVVTIYNENVNIIELTVGKYECIREEYYESKLTFPAILYNDCSYMYISDAEVIFNVELVMDEYNKLNIFKKQHHLKLRDFAFMYRYMDMDDIYAMVGFPNLYYDKTKSIYQLDNNIKLILIQDHSGNLDTVKLESGDGTVINIEYENDIGLVKFHNLPEYFTQRYVNDRNSILLTRSDCLVFVMLCIGAKSYTYDYNEDFFLADDRADIIGWDKAMEFICDYNAEKLMFDDKFDLVGSAYKYAGISNGRYNCGPENKYVYFDCFDFVTLNEALAYMVRCINFNCTFKTLDEVMDIAKDDKLLEESDYFANMPDKKLTLGEFKVILNRFVELPRGLFHIKGKYTSYEFDADKTKTYKETLIEYYSEEYVKSLLEFDGSFSWEY